MLIWDVMEMALALYGSGEMTHARYLCWTMLVSEYNLLMRELWDFIKAESKNAKVAYKHWLLQLNTLNCNFLKFMVGNGLL